MSQNGFYPENLSKLINQINDMQRMINNVRIPIYNTAYNFTNSLQPTTQTIQKYINNNPELLKRIKNAVMVSANLHIAVNSTLEPILKYYIANYEQINDALARVHQASLNINLENIDFDKLNELYEDDYDEGDDHRELSDFELQELNAAIIDSSSGTSFNLTLFVNKLIDLALKYKNQIIVGLLCSIFTQVILPLSKDVVSYIYPPESIKVFRELREERMQQLSLQLKNKLPQEELRHTRIVIARELNVKNEPNTNAVNTDRLYFGREVKTMQCYEEWIFIQWNDEDGIKAGWVKSRYLAEVKDEE